MRLELFPLCANEHTVNSFQGRMGALLAPGEKSALEVNLLERRIIQESTKLPHQSLVKVAIVLVFHFIVNMELKLLHKLYQMCPKYH
jgi:hypothetical protein